MEFIFVFVVVLFCFNGKGGKKGGEEGGAFSLLFTQQSQRALHIESKYSTAVAIAFSQIRPERKMIELGAIMVPFCK